jgi:hypothetical protein
MRSVITQSIVLSCCSSSRLVRHVSGSSGSRSLLPALRDESAALRDQLSRLFAAFLAEQFSELFAHANVPWRSAVEPKDPARR